MVCRCAVAVVLAGWLIAPAWSAAQDNVTRVPDKLMQVWLEKNKDMPSNRLGKGKFQIEMDDVKVQLTNKQVDCWLHVGFDTGGKGDLEAVNRWNSGAYCTRAYLDEEGDPCLEMDIDFEGGMNEFAFYSCLNWFKLQLARFQEEVVP